MPSWMVGIDIGGTFTDVAATEVASGVLRIAKVMSTPTDPSRAVIDGLARLCETEPEPRPSDIGFFAHGTTVATNALLEQKGARRPADHARLQRHLRAAWWPASDRLRTCSTISTKSRPSWSALDSPRRSAAASPTTARSWSRSTRGGAPGRRRLRERDVNSIAVCYLFSFMNPRHEQRTAEIIREEHPTCRISLSSVVLPIIREYPRLSTTVLDAYVGPVIETYLKRLAERLREVGLTTEQMFIMQSNGGLMRIDVATSYPNETLLSGPAAGVIFGANVARQTGRQKIITLDMGGTSTDISVIAGAAFEETRQGKIAGQDIGTPMIGIRTLGAGGGTIAWIGPDGLLKAGPHSAGGDPGPACYGLGGEQPTVTDANVTLGYLDPDYLAGGRLKIHPQLSEQAIRRHVAEPLGLSVHEAALGIVRVVNVNMEVGLRLSLVERGQDHREFSLVAFGGPDRSTAVAWRATWASPA